LEGEGENTEFETVLRAVNHLGRGTENLDVAPVERKGDVVRGLTTHGDQDTSRVLELVDVQHSLDTDVLEVEAVGFVVIWVSSVWCYLKIRSSFATAVPLRHVRCHQRARKGGFNIPVLTVSGLYFEGISKFL
jgi:hypothetical protein